jgi:hypothetical protein
MQAHVIRSFRAGMWGALNATCFRGGITKLNEPAASELSPAAA